MTSWRPTRILAQRGNATTTSACAVPVRTDAGPAFAKTLGAPEEPPSALACDRVGSRLGQCLGLPIPPVAICQLDLSLVLDEHGHQAVLGPAFLSQEVNAGAWDASAEQLQGVRNPDALAGVMVLDTWILNVDRYSRKPDGAVRANPRNLLIERKPGRGGRPQRLVWIIDHTHCLTRRDGDSFVARPDAIDNVKDDRVFGLFPAMVPLVTEASTGRWIEAMRSIDDARIRAILAEVPPQWEVTTDQRDALGRLLIGRRDYLIEQWRRLFAPACEWQDAHTNLSPEEE